MAEYDPADGFQRACIALLVVVGVVLAWWVRRAPRRAAADGRTWLGSGWRGRG